MYNKSGQPILHLLSSKNIVVRVVMGETITISWPGSKVNRTESIMVLVKCVQKDMILLNSTLVDIDQLGCARNFRENSLEES